jgi:hypothetical protein
LKVSVADSTDLAQLWVGFVVAVEELGRVDFGDDFVAQGIAAEAVGNIDFGFDFVEVLEVFVEEFPGFG